MLRRIPVLLAILAIAVAACGGSSGSPAAAALSDPKAILTSTAGSLQNLKTVHFKVAATGHINPGALTGGSSDATPDPGASPALLDLSGTTVEGDIDITDASGQVAVSVPTIFGLSANVIEIGGIAYIKSSLTGPQFSKLDTTALTSALPIPSLGLTASPDPAAASAVISALDAELAKLPAPTKLADETVNGQDSYHVQEKVASTDVPQASGLLGGTTGNLTVDVWTSKADLRPTRIVLAVDAGSDGSLTLTVDLTNYDAAVTIAAPPADQVSDKPFSLPGLTP